jgi:hypothetical protein
MKDTDLMPFGEYKGIPMQDVPASYLHWWYRNAPYTRGLNEPTIDSYRALLDYIHTSWDALVMETPDLIWRHI